MRYLTTLTLVFSLLFSSLAQADLVLSAAPREDSAEGDKTYGPLAKQLSTVLGENIVYQHPTSWAEYSEKIRNDSYDILLDGPHLTSWRMKHTDYQPVARLPGYLAFKFVARKDDRHLNDLQSLRLVKVCAFATPNLTAVALLDRYRNELIAPTVVPIKGTMGDIYKGLMGGKCDAAVLRDQFYDKILTEDQRSQLKVIYHTRKFPNQGFSVSRRIDTKKQAQILKVLQGDPSIKPIIERFAKKAKHFVPSRKEEYDGASNLLEGVVWGW